MNGELGTVAVKPDQMQALNPILILVLIPIFEFGVYPLAAKCHLLKRYGFVPVGQTIGAACIVYYVFTESKM